MSTLHPPTAAAATAPRKSSATATRYLVPACGIVGVLVLTAHFLIPMGFPRDSAGIAEISSYARSHRTAILLSAWMQVTGAILYVLFTVAVAHLAGASRTLAGQCLIVAGAILVSLTLLDSALIIGAVQAATAGHFATLRTCYDLIVGPGNDGVGRTFLMAPAIMLAFGLAILRTDLLPRRFTIGAICFGVVSQILGLVGLFSAIAFADINPAVLGLENLWLIVIAVAVLRHRADR